MGYIETLFGHQAPVLGIDALHRETAVSVGGRDKSVRYWKVPEESQLVFRGGGRSGWEDVLEGRDLEDNMDVDADGNAKEKQRKKKAGRKTEEKFLEGSLECVAMIDESTFVSGGDSGYVSLSLWTFRTLLKRYVVIDRYVFGRHRRRSRFSHKALHMGLMKHRWILKTWTLCENLAG